MTKHKGTPGQRGEYAEPGAKAVRPRDAATLIIIRDGGDRPHVLMGKRAATHKFMPNKFVFPGGRIDLADMRVARGEKFHPDVARRLAQHVTAQCDEARQRGLAMAAIRETFEETGLIFGIPTDTPLRSRNPIWNSYFNAGVRPAIERLDFIARAITPTYRTRRFDTRFFMGYAEELHSNPEQINSSGELLDIHWLDFDAARALDLPVVTRQILDVVEARLALPKAQRYRATATHTRFVNGAPVVVQLT